MPAANPRAGTHAAFVDPAALMRIRSLELRARTVVEGFWRGIHRSPYHGFSSEFAEYRPYAPGDDPRHLDWKLLARTDRACTRKFEEETNVRCHFLLDVSESMSFGTVGWSKFEYARTLVASLAVFMQQQGDALGLITFGAKVGTFIPARQRGRARHEILAALEAPVRDRTTAVDVAVDELLRAQTKRGIVILVSDLLTPIDRLESRLQALAACGHDVSVQQVLDRAEIEFPFKESALFEDVESGDRRQVNPEAARASYLKQFGEHQDRIRTLCSRVGILHRVFPTDEHLEKALFEHLHDREQRRRGIRRAQQLR